MFFEKVLSYKNAWSIVNDNYAKELEEIQFSLAPFIENFISQKKKQLNARLSSREIWETLLLKKGWNIIDRTIYSDTGKRIRIDSLGPVKRNICASVPLSYLEFFNRWFFVHSIVAVKYGIIKMPILLIPTSKYTSIIEDKWLKRTSFESIFSQIDALSPISHPIPFLIIGFTEQININGTEVLELESDPLVKSNNRIFEWEAKFPQSFYQAGLEILNFFGTYLREQYPNESADVTVKQVGLNIRLVVESKDTEPYIVEKAFGEYKSIISGKESPDRYIKDENLILKLETQLEIARMQIKLNEKFIKIRERDINHLISIIEKGADYKPTMIVENNINLNNIQQDVRNSIECINELTELISRSSAEYLRLKDLEKALDAIKNVSDKEIIKNSSALNKLNKLIDSLQDKNSNLRKFLDTINDGWQLFRKLAQSYNKIAQWCGLPQVPSVLL